MSSGRIVVVGSYNHDVSLSVARMPAPGETLLGLGRVESPGGKGSNQAIQAARAGAATAMIAALGQDAAADQALALWAGDGIDVSGVARLAEAGTGMAVILVDAAGENMIVVDSGANALLAPAHIDAATGLIDQSGLVLAQLETPAAATLRAFELARACDAITVLNAAPAPERLDPALLAAVDILVVNEVEGRALSGHDHAAAIGEALLGRVGRAVVVTLGARGAMLFEHQRPPLALGSPSVDVVDTTGAGDAFTGAFAARLVETGDAAAALAWGVAAGALACTVRGAAASCAYAAAIAALV
ncbi:MAG TPA: ribokinase [Caulobacteraceae bacterium]|nr:ribokinase [Caulobacteraceae bacterium]